VAFLTWFNIDHHLDPNYAQVLAGAPNATPLVKRLERHSNQAVPDDPRDGPQLGAKRTPSSLLPPRSSPSLLMAALAAPSHRHRPRAGVGAINAACTCTSSLRTSPAASLTAPFSLPQPRSPPSLLMLDAQQQLQQRSLRTSSTSLITPTPSPRTHSKPLLAPTLVALLDQHSALLQTEAAKSRDPGDRFMCSLVAGLGTTTRSALLMTRPTTASSSIDSD
jgi:hypothetical protein